MGLLDRLRTGRDGHEASRRVEDDGAEVPEPSGSDAEPRASTTRDVIGPGVYNPAGPWNWVPPMPMLIPDMPLVVPPFEESLISHQLPEPFSSGLGHLVSDEAPAGFVEPVAVLGPQTAPDNDVTGEEVGQGTWSAQADQLLPLAVNPVRAAPELEDGSVEPVELLSELPVVRPQPSDGQSLVAADRPQLPLQPLPSWPLPEEVRAELVARAQTSQPIEAPAPDQDPSIGSAAEESSPTAGLVGGRPLAGTGEEAESPAPRDEPAIAGGLVSTQGHPASEDRPVSDDRDRLALAVPPPARPGATDRQEAQGADQPVGFAERSGIDGGPEPTITASPPDRADEPPPPPAALTPAAGPTVEAPSDSIPSGEVDAPGDLDVAPLLGPSDPLIAGAVPPSVASGAEPVQGIEPRPAIEAMPLAALHAPESGESAPVETEQPVVAPLVGATPPIAELPPAEASGSAEESQQEDPASRPARSRSGLGAPMHSVPPTSRSYDLTTLSSAEQREMRRALMAGRSGPQASLPLAQPPTETVPQASRVPPQMLGQMAEARVQPFPPEVSGVTSEGPPPVPGGRFDTPEPVAGSEQVAPLVAFNDMTGSPVSSDQPARAESEQESAAVRAEVGMRYGLDLAHVPVDRSPKAALEAHFAGARAFTTDSGIVIPPSAGTLKGGEGAALLAHELTHVAQRMHGGATAPDETSPEGRILEAEARRTEMVYAVGGQLPPWGLGPPPDPGRQYATPGSSSTPGVWPGGASLPVVTPQPVGFASAPPSGAPMPLASPGHSAGADAEAIAQTVLERVSALMPSPAPYTEVVVPASPPPVAAPVGMQRAELDPKPEETGSPPTTTEPATQGTDPGLPRPSEEDLNNLSRWLYPLIRYRLKRELREDRERAGLLTDHYRRW